MKSNKVANIFFNFIVDYPAYFLIIFLLLLIDGLCATASVLSLMPIIDYLIDPSMVKASKFTLLEVELLKKLSINVGLLPLGLVFVLTSFLQGLIVVFIRYFILKIKYAVIRDIFGSSLNAFFNAKWTFFCDLNRGQVLNSLNKEMTIIGDTFGHLASMFSQIFQLLIYLTVPMILNWELTLSALLLVMAFVSPILLLHKLSYKLGKLNLESSNKITGVLNELFNLAKVIIGFGMQNKSLDKYFQAFDSHVYITLRSQILVTAVPKIFQPLSIAAILVAISFNFKPDNSFSEVAAVMWSLMAAMPLVGILVNGRLTIGNFLPSYEQLMELKLNAKSVKEISGDREFVDLKKGIFLSNVSFKYGDGPCALNNISIDIKAGSVNAIIGESGAGKSTLIDLIMGMQSPNSGSIYIDEVNISEYKIHSYRQKIGYVPQDPILFDASIKDNLLWSNENASESDLWSAIENSNSIGFVKNLPDGLDTIVGDRGVKLSGGQRQRIALARSLIRIPSILILDEATSSLDAESEKLVQEAISRIQKTTTIIIIAHRLTTIAGADMVYVLSSGRVIEQGSYVDLSNNQNSYLNKIASNQTP